MYFCLFFNVTKLNHFFFNFQSTPGKPMDPLQSLHVRTYFFQNMIFGQWKNIIYHWNFESSFSQKLNITTLDSEN